MEGSSGELATARPSRPSGIAVAALSCAMASDPVAERLRFRVVISRSVPGAQDEIEEWHEVSRGEQWRSLHMRFQDRFGVDTRYLWLVINGNLSLVMQPDFEIYPLADGERLALRFVPSPPPSPPSSSESGSVSEESDIDYY